MRNRSGLLVAMVVLLVLLPAVGATAAPRVPYLSVGDWTLPIPVEDLPVTTKLAAWDINWRAPKAAILELGYVICAAECQRVVEVTYELSAADRYPQHLHLQGETRHLISAGGCYSHQFINIRDREGAFMVGTVSPLGYVCIRP